MKVILILMMTLLMLTGCNSAQVYETVTDEPIAAVSAQPREIRIDLAQEPILPAMESDGAQLYLCGDFDVMVQTLDSGDLNDTVFRISGFLPEELTLLQTASGDVDKYEFVWTSLTDEGHQIGRVTILDDGSYHYTLSATVDAELIEEYQEIWNGIFESFELT